MILIVAPENHSIFFCCKFQRDGNVGFFFFEEMSDASIMTKNQDENNL